MKKIILFLLLCFISTWASEAFAQYKGKQYFGFGGGIVIYDNIDSRMVFEKAPSPNIQFYLNYGYQVFNRTKIEALIGYRQLSNDIVRSNTFVISPSCHYAFYRTPRLSLSLGGGVLAGVQTLKSENDMITLSTDDNQPIWGLALIPRIEYLLTHNIGINTDYRLELQLNSIRKLNHIISLGLTFYF